MRRLRRASRWVLGCVFVAAILSPHLARAEPPQFIRGDYDESGKVDFADAMFGLIWMFQGSRPPTCYDAADANDSGTIDIADPVYLLSYFFLGGPPPPAPGHETCGPDPTEDNLHCVYYEHCRTKPPETRVLVIAIEYESTKGLENFVYECQKRGIQPVCIAPGMFVQEHCEVFRKLQSYGMEIIGLTGPFMWGTSYEEQYRIARNTKELIEDCTGRPLKILSTKLFATDPTTCRVAHELGIPYVFARGSTGTRSTVYKPIEYDVTVVSVSNMESERWAHGSLCDWSIWARTGTPDDFRGELNDAIRRHDRITMASHTRVGGLKKNWFDVWLEVFDDPRLVFQSLDEFAAEPDIVLPVTQIPQNWSNPYGPAPKPIIPYEEEPNVDNPCEIGDFPPPAANADVGEKIVFYHNAKGSMYLDLLEFLETLDYPKEEHVLGEPDFWTKLNSLKAAWGSSEGLSESFGFFPIIFVKTRAFSGFSDAIRNSILQVIGG